MTLRSAALLAAAEEEPRNNAAFPEANKITAASTLTFGRAS